MDDNGNFRLGERLGVIEGDVKTLSVKIDRVDASIQSLTNGIGKRVENHGNDITTLQTEMGFVKKLALLIFTPTIAALALAIIYQIIKHQ